MTAASDGSVQVTINPWFVLVFVAIIAVLPAFYVIQQASQPTPRPPVPAADPFRVAPSYPVYPSRCPYRCSYCNPLGTGSALPGQVGASK